MEVAPVPEAPIGHASRSYLVTDLISTGKQLGDATRLQIGNVYTTDLDGVRTNRSEATLVRDLEYLRIHDTKTGRAVASYPDSAPWFHVAKPHCLLVKQKDGRMRRLMWQALSSHLPGNEEIPVEEASKGLASRRAAEGRWLKCKTDYVDQDGSSIPDKQQPGSTETAGDVSCLESIILGHKVFLLAAYTNGVLAAYTEDLIVASSPIADSMLGETIKFMTTISAKHAKAGILRPIKDIHSTLDGSRLLVLLSQPKDVNTNKLRVRIFQLTISSSSPNKPVGALLVSQEVLLDKAIKNDYLCSVHGRGQLHIWNQKTLWIFDLSDNPNQAYRTLHFSDDIISVFRLSQTSVAVCTTKTFDRINLEYSTSIGTLTWPEPLTPSAVTGYCDSQIFNYDQKTEQVLCLYNSKVVSITMTGKEPTMIADLIDRGLNQSHVSAHYQLASYEKHLAKNHNGESNWSEWISHVESLSDCVRENNIFHFDEIFVELLKFISSSPVEQDIEAVSLSPLQHLKNEEKFAVILSNVFEPDYTSYNQNGALGVKVKILPEKTFHWLVNHGYISSSNLEQAFRRLGKITSESIHDSAVLMALNDFDATLSTMHYYVKHRDFLSAVESSCAIRCALNAGDGQAAQNEPDESATRNLPVEEIPDLTLQPRKTARHRKSISKQHSAALLRLSILRLIDNDHSEIIQALRHQLDHRSLLALINWLRIEMATQGWFADVLYDSAYSKKIPGDQQNISRLAKLLGCVLDALSMAPWLNSATLHEQEHLIGWMRTEVSAALEAVEEATYMSGILHEVELFTKHLNFAETRPSQASRRKEPVLVDDGLLGNNALPAGLKPAGYIDTNVVKAGKTQKMSSRQIGHMKSKMVGAYTREKIDLNDFYKSSTMQKRKRK